MFCPVMADLGRYERAEAAAYREEEATKQHAATLSKDADAVAECLDLSDPIDVAEAMVAAKGASDAVRLAAYDAMAAALWKRVEPEIYDRALTEVRERAA